MTAAPKDTRSALFEAGITLIEALGVDAVTLASVGKGAGVTRQTVYLHFGSRAGYLLALVDFVNERQGIARGIEAAARAPSARTALQLLIQLRANTAPQLQPLISAVNAAVLSDPDALAIWTKRQSLRYTVFRALAERMRKEKWLRRGVTAEDAASLMWALLSFETWNYLVIVQQWPKAKYMKHVRDMIIRGICNESG